MKYINSTIQSKIKVCAYVQFHRLQNPSGAGKFILNVIQGLKMSDVVDLSIMTSRNDYIKYGKATILGDIPTRVFPLNISPMQRLWGILGFPKADRWCGDADWLYCPAETYVPVDCASLAVSVMDVHAFETELPWSNTLAHRKFRMRWQMLFHRIRKKAKLYCTISEYTKSRLVRYLGINPAIIRVVGCGVEDLYFKEPKDSGNIHIRDPYLLVIGGLTQRKGGTYILNAARTLGKYHPDMKILVVGNCHEPYASLAHDHDNIILLSYVPDTKLVLLLRNALALYFPSLYEGFGIPSLEAMAAGTPAIVSHHAALPETVGDAGIVLDPADTESVMEVVTRLRSDSDYRQGFIDKGRIRAENFRWSQCVDRVIDSLCKGDTS